MKTYLEYKDDKSHKFWEIEQGETQFTVTYGKINTNGQSKTKDFDSEEEARLEAAKLIKQKLKKGYVDISTSTKVLKNDIDAKKMSNEEYYFADKVRFYEKSATINGDLSLDFNDEENEDSPAYFKGIVVEGDLTVKGNITNFEDDFGKFLDIKGNLYANNIIIGGSELKVNDKITAQTFVVQTYNHGEIIAKSIKCPILVTEERSPEIEDDSEIDLQLKAGYGDGSYEIITHFYYYKDDDGNYIDIAELIDEITKGKEEKAYKQLFSFTKKHHPNLILEKKKEKKKIVKKPSLSTVSFLKECAKKIEINNEEIAINTIDNYAVSEITLLDFSKNDFKEFPECIAEFKSLQTLILTTNKITKIPDALGNLENLTKLDLVNNNITSISKGILALENLEELNLSENNIRVIPKSIKKLTNLTLFNISSNKVSGIPIELSTLTKLTNLDIGLNHLESLPEQLFDLINLTYLDVSFTYNTDFNHIGKLINLQEISFYNCYLKEIPKGLFQLKELIILNLRNNSFSKIPNEIKTLNKLEWLNLSSNPLGTIPHALTALDSLNYLDLFLCRIKEVPKYISEFTHLKELRLDGNDIPNLDNIHFPNLTYLSLDNMKLTKIATSITNISSLTYLKLSSNDIKEIPTGIGNLKNLKVLLISGYKGKVKALPVTFKNLTKLEKLDLSSNQFTEIPKEVFTLTNLIELDFGVNKISHIPKEIANLKNLEYCSLRKNSITNLPDEITSLKKMKTLLLSDNQLNKIPEDIGKLENLESAFFGDNNINSIPQSIVSLQKIKKGWFDTLPNPITNVPENILKQGFYAIQKYFEEQPKKSKGFFGFFKK